MKRCALALLFAALGALAAPVLAQTSMNIVSGQVWTAAQWNTWSQTKMDYNPAGIPVIQGGTGATTANQGLTNLGGLPSAGGTSTGTQTFVGSTFTFPSILIPAGIAPTSPTNGSVWGTTAGLWYQADGVTEQMATVAKSLQVANNLSDVATPATALANLGGAPATTTAVTFPTVDAMMAGIVPSGAVAITQGDVYPGDGGGATWVPVVDVSPLATPSGAPTWVGTGSIVNNSFTGAIASIPTSSFTASFTGNLMTLDSNASGAGIVVGQSVEDGNVHITTPTEVIALVSGTANTTGAVYDVNQVFASPVASDSVESLGTNVLAVSAIDAGGQVAVGATIPQLGAVAGSQVTAISAPSGGAITVSYFFLVPVSSASMTASGATLTAAATTSGALAVGQTLYYGGTSALGAGGLHELVTGVSGSIATLSTAIATPVGTTAMEALPPGARCTDNGAGVCLALGPSNDFNPIMLGAAHNGGNTASGGAASPADDSAAINDASAYLATYFNGGMLRFGKNIYAAGPSPIQEASNVDYVGETAYGGGSTPVTEIIESSVGIDVEPVQSSGADAPVNYIKMRDIKIVGLTNTDEVIDATTVGYSRFDNVFLYGNPIVFNVGLLLGATSGTPAGNSITDLYTAGVDAAWALQGYAEADTFSGNRGQPKPGGSCLATDSGATNYFYPSGITEIGDICETPFGSVTARKLITGSNITVMATHNELPGAATTATYINPATSCGVGGNEPCVANVVLLNNTYSGVATPLNDAAHIATGIDPALPGGGILTGPQLINLSGSTLPAGQNGDVVQAAGGASTMARTELDSFAGASYFTGVRADGTPAAPTAVQSGDELGGYNAFGYNGSGNVGPRAAFRTYAAQAWTGSANGTYADIAVTPIGSTSEAEALRIDGSGGIYTPNATGGDEGAGTINAQGFYVNGSAVLTAGGSNSIPLGNLYQVAANTVLGNATGSTANVAAQSVPSCSAPADALIWTPGTGFGCNGSINALTLNGNNFTNPGPIGTGTAAAGDFTTVLTGAGSVSAPTLGIGSSTIGFYESAGDLALTFDGATSNWSWGPGSLVDYTFAANGEFGCYRANGTQASPTAVAAGNALCELPSYGWDGSAYTRSSLIETLAEGTISSGVVPGQIDWFTASAAGTLTLGAYLDDAQLFHFQAGFFLKGSSTGGSTFASADAGSTSYTVTVPAASGTLAFDLAGTTGSIGGSALAAGSCATGTVSVSGATTAMAVAVSGAGGTDPGGSYTVRGYVSAAGTVTAEVCALSTGTPTAQTYNVRVLQ